MQYFNRKLPFCNHLAGINSGDFRRRVLRERLFVFTPVRISGTLTEKYKLEVLHFCVRYVRSSRIAVITGLSWPARPVRLQKNFKFPTVGKTKTFCFREAAGMLRYYHKNPDRFIRLTIRGSTITTFVCMLQRQFVYHCNFLYDIMLNAFAWFRSFISFFRELGTTIILVSARGILNDIVFFFISNCLLRCFSMNANIKR